jgi:hypothetical protein
MPLPYTRPGVYPSVVSTPFLQPSGSGGAVAALIGTAPKGSSQPGALYGSFADFVRDYGDPAVNPGYTLPGAAQQFFAQSQPNGSVRPSLMVVRVGSTLATSNLNSGALVLSAQPAYAGSVGNSITVVAAASVYVSTVTTGSPYLQTYQVVDPSGYTENYSVYDVNTGPNAMGLLQALLVQKSTIVNVSSYTNGAFLPAATYVFSGGTDGKGALIASTDVAKLEIQAVDFVCALQGDLATAQLVQTHVDAMSSLFKPRVGFAGFSIGTAMASRLANFGTLADAAGRMVCAGHDAFYWYNAATGYQEQHAGYELAALLMGIKSSNRPEMPLTNRQAQGIVGPVEQLTAAQQDTISKSGGCCLDRTPQGVFVLDGVTTAPQTSIYAYLGIRHCEDVLVRALIIAGKGLIGQPGGPNIKQMIETSFRNVLTAAVNNGTISNFQNPVASPSLTQVGVWTVTIPYVPRGEIRVLYLNLSVTIGS